MGIWGMQTNDNNYYMENLGNKVKCRMSARPAVTRNVCIRYNSFGSMIMDCYINCITSKLKQLVNTQLEIKKAKKSKNRICVFKTLHWSAHNSLLLATLC